MRLNPFVMKAVVYTIILLAAIIGVVIIVFNSQNKSDNRGIDGSGKVSNTADDITGGLEGNAIDFSKPESELQKKLYGITPDAKYLGDYSIVTCAQVRDLEYLKAVLASKDKSYLWNHAVKALGIIGTEQAVDVLLGLIPEDKELPYSPLSLSLPGVVHALGLAANKSDRAYTLIQQACAPQYWEKVLKHWSIPIEAHVSGPILVSAAIRCLPLSGRKDAITIIYGFAQNEIYAKGYNSEVVDAMIYGLMVEEFGYKRFMSEVYFPSFELFQDWLTKKHPEWYKWHQGGHLPPLDLQRASGD